MAYQKKFNKPFPGGYRDFPDESTIITASVMDNYDKTLEDFDTEFESVDGKLEKLKGVDNLKSAFKLDESGNPTGVEVTGDVVANGVSLIATKEAVSANEANITEINSSLTSVENRVTSVEKKATDNADEIVRVDGRVNELKGDLDDVSDEIVRDNLIKPANIEIGFFSVSDSKLKKETNSAYRRIENIKIPLVNDGKVYIRTEGYSKIFFQDSDKTVVSSATLKADHTIVQNIEIPENVAFLSMFWATSVLTEIGQVFVSTTKSELKKFFYENFSLPNYEFSENVDNTLSISGKAADAKAVGDVIKSIFDGKIMLFAGDSICYGANWRPTPDDYSTTGWRKLVQEKYPTAKTYGYGVGGTTIAIRANRTDSIYERLTKMYSEHSDADYVILQGGINDCWGNVPLGEITTNYNKELDTSTFCGAMEQLLKDAILKWKGKKIGFICTYKVHDADTIISSGEIVWDFKSYMDKAKEICNKWSVSYCDLYNDSGLCLKLDDIANTYSDGGTHVNELGYRTIFPKIDSWLKTL